MKLQDWYHSQSVKQKSMYGGVAVAVLVVAGIVAYSGGDGKEKKAPAANVDKILKEETFNTITLSEEAEGRIGIQLAPVVVKKVQRNRLYNGEIITPVGRRGVVTAPFGGILREPEGGIPKVGDTVSKGQTIFVLLPLLTAEARSTTATAQVDADMQVQNASTQHHAAKAALERAQKLFDEGAGAKRTIDESQAVFDTTAKTLEAAKARQKLLEESLNEGTASPILIAAPEDGVLRKISAAHGQNVPGGSALFEMGDLSTAWMRVSLPMGDLEDIARDKDAHVGTLSAHGENPLRPAMSVISPPLANSVAYTVELLYVLHNLGKEEIPGQRIGVMLPLTNAKESLTVPASAIVFDAWGGSWVYVQSGEHAYTRKRVSISYIAQGDAVLSSGPLAQTPVITAGAQSLLGAETGTMK